MYTVMWRVVQSIVIMTIGFTGIETTMPLAAKSTGPALTKGHGNILVLSMPSYSRWYSLVNIAHELKEMGYTTTFVFPDGQAR